MELISAYMEIAVERERKNAIFEPFQGLGIEEAWKDFYNLSETRICAYGGRQSGKTWNTVKFAVHSPNDVLIICPKDLLNQMYDLVMDEIATVGNYTVQSYASIGGYVIEIGGGKLIEIIKYNYRIIGSTFLHETDVIVYEPEIELQSVVELTMESLYRREPLSIRMVGSMISTERHYMKSFYKYAKTKILVDSNLEDTSLMLNRDRCQYKPSLYRLMLERSSVADSSIGSY